MPNPRIDLTGERFGRWTVVALAPRDTWHGTNTSWTCRCDCGTERVVIGTKLRNGSSQSCGCLAAELTSKRSTTHGHTRRVATGAGEASREYRTWMAMRRRCKDPRDKSYALYGGRGVAVCSRWENFEDFLADMGPRPSGTTLDRIDPDGNYEPENCRWATGQEQRANRRDRL